MNDPFESEERGRRRSSWLAAMRLRPTTLLLDFLHAVMSAGEPTAPLAAVQAAVAEVKQAEVLPHGRCSRDCRRRSKARAKRLPGMRSAG